MWCERRLLKQPFLDWRCQHVHAGLISRVVSLDNLLEEALVVAATIAQYSLLSVMIKKSINRVV